MNNYIYHNKFNIFLVSILLTTIVSQSCKNIDTDAIVIDLKNKEYIPINQCQIIGPFAYNPDSINLKDYNYFSKEEAFVGKNNVALRVLMQKKLKKEFLTGIGILCLRNNV